MKKSLSAFWWLLMVVSSATIYFFYLNVQQPFVYQQDQIAVGWSPYIHSFETYGVEKTGLALLKPMSILGKEQWVYQWQELAGLPLIIWLISTILPIGETGLRLIALSISAMTLLGIYLLGKTIHNKWTGLLAVSLVVVHPLFIHFSAILHPALSMFCLWIWLGWGLLQYSYHCQKKYLIIIFLGMGLLSLQSWFAFGILLATIIGFSVSFPKHRFLQWGLMMVTGGLFFLNLWNLSRLIQWQFFFLSDQVLSYISQASFSPLGFTGGIRWLGTHILGIMPIFLLVMTGLFVWQCLRSWWIDDQLSKAQQQVLFIVGSCLAILGISPQLMITESFYQWFLLPLWVLPSSLVLSQLVSLWHLKPWVKMAVYLGVICMAAYDGLPQLWRLESQARFLPEWYLASQLQSASLSSAPLIMHMSDTYPWDVQMLSWHTGIEVLLLPSGYLMTGDELMKGSKQNHQLVVYEAALPSKEILQYYLTNFTYQKNGNLYIFQW